MVLSLWVPLSLFCAGLSLSIPMVGLNVFSFYVNGVIRTRFICIYVYNLALSGCFGSLAPKFLEVAGTYE